MPEHEWYYGVLFPDWNLSGAEHLQFELNVVVNRAMRFGELEEQQRDYKRRLPVVVQSALPIYTSVISADDKCQRTGSPGQVDIITRGEPCLVCFVNGYRCPKVSPRQNDIRCQPANKQSMKIVVHKKRKELHPREISDAEFQAYLAQLPAVSDAVKGWFITPRQERTYPDHECERRLFSALHFANVVSACAVHAFEGELMRVVDPEFRVRPPSRHDWRPLPIPNVRVIRMPWHF